MNLFQLIPFKIKENAKQPFHLYGEDEINQLAESIKISGVLDPVIVPLHKEKAGCYEIIAGHNRTIASKLAGVELTYLSEENRKFLADYLDEKSTLKINLNQALALRELEKEKNLYSDVLDEFFNPHKSIKEKTKTSISI